MNFPIQAWVALGLLVAVHFLGWFLGDISRKKREKKEADSQLFLSPSRFFFGRLLKRVSILVIELFVFVLGTTLIFYPIVLGTMWPRYSNGEDVKKKFLAYWDSVQKAISEPTQAFETDMSDYFSGSSIRDWYCKTVEDPEKFDGVENYCFGSDMNLWHPLGYYILSESALQSKNAIEQVWYRITVDRYSYSLEESAGAKSEANKELERAATLLANPSPPPKINTYDMSSNAFFQKIRGDIVTYDRYAVLHGEQTEEIISNEYTLFWELAEIPKIIYIPQLSPLAHLREFFIGGDYGFCIPISKSELSTFFELTRFWQTMPTSNVAFEEAQELRDDTYYLYFSPKPSVASVLYDYLSDAYTVAILIFAVLLVLLILSQYITFTIRAQKHARKQLEDIRNYTHDMKTPLAILWQYSDQVALENFPPAERELMGKIKSGLQDMARRVQGILEFMRQGTGTLNISEFSLRDVAEDCLLEISPLLDDKGARWSVTQTDIRMEADQGRVEQAIRNMLSNAAKHTPQGGRVDVRVTQEKKKLVRVTVFNSGEGVPKGELKKIWDMFYSLDGGGDNALRGTGIGLAMVRDTAARHRGSSDCRNVDDGVEFWIEIPQRQKKKRGYPHIA